MIKKNIIIISVITIFAFSLGVGAATMFNAKDISYTPNDESWKVDNLNDAIDDLYHKSKKYDTMKVYLDVRGTEAQAHFHFYGYTTQNLYKYFKVTNLDGDSSLCKIYGWAVQNSKSVLLDFNKEYEILSTTDGYKIDTVFALADASIYNVCKYTIELYN